ncbi:aldose 1-epimerase [Portibacter lacus]|uniref:Aldose 1-epimerase n=2 Tax=Portibacter lacus TaxID=1099794 RepID=A0AA37SRX9_9BACT|nr:aldose 1-epimerase [Portibacter lacus]
MVKITNYGGIIQSILVPDKNGKVSDITIGFDSLSGYEQIHPYFGATIGRYGNRIGNGKYTLEGEEYKLATNNGPNHLHGGIKGFDKRVWNAKVEGEELKLSLLSKDMEEGYPGNLEVEVKFKLDNDNKLHIEYTATTDKATVINLTNHSYFNLGGESTILDHKLRIDADKMTAIDATLIPTGELADVDGTPFDFRSMKVIGKDIEQDNEQLVNAGGYDHNFVLNAPDINHVSAEIYHEGSGRFVKVYTEEPGIQFYSGNFLNGTLEGKNGEMINKHKGMCLETQHFPDSPNKANFPSTVLRPEDVYQTKTIYEFGVR